MNAPRKPIEEAWDKCRPMLAPPTAGEGQIADTRRAFFAGAIVTFEALVKDDSPVDCYDLLEAYRHEVESELADARRTVEEFIAGQRARGELRKLHALHDHVLRGVPDAILSPAERAKLLEMLSHRIDELERRAREH